MRIWQVTRLDVSGPGGVEKHVAEVSSALKRRGHHVHVGMEPPPWPDPARIVHTHGDTWPSVRLLRALRAHPASRWVHVCHGTSVGRVIACREFASLSGWRGSLRDFLPARLAHAAVAVSERALGEARRYFRMSLPAAVIPNGANPGEFTALASVSKEPRAIYVGRGDDRVKNLPLLLAAFESLWRERPGTELWMAPGIRESRPYLKSLGFLAGRDLARALAQCRALVLCSFYEGDPIVVREAQAMGLPVVVSDLPQLRAALRDYANATFVDPRDERSIASGLRQALYGEAPRPSPRLRSWDEVAADFEAFYLSLDGAKPR